MVARPWNIILGKHYDVYVKPAPCDGCYHWQRCKEELLACDVFKAYVMRNQHWRKERMPNKKIWEDIFIHDKDDDKHLSQKKKPKEKST